MRIVGMMLVDLERGGLGLPSSAGVELAGQPVVRRAVSRALAAKRLSQVAIIAPAEQHGRINALLAGLEAGGRLRLYALPARSEPGAGDMVFGGVDPRRVRAARMWALSGWRGGLCGACWFDELIAPVAMGNLGIELKADAVVALSPDAAVMDAGLVDAIVDQYELNAEHYRMTFSQAPPGLGAACLGMEMMADLARGGLTVGAALAYDPDNPAADLVASDSCVKIPIDVMACGQRFCADTARGRRLLERIIAQCGDCPTFERSARTAEEIFATECEFAPREIEVELTTERAGGTREMPDPLRPGRPLVPRRGPMGQTIVERLCESIRECPADDVVVTLGGFGDPLAHPRAFDIAADLKRAGCLGVGLRTSGLTLDETSVGELLDSPIDVLCVELDAATAEGYRRVKGHDGYERVVASLDMLTAERDRRGQAAPLLTAEMIKCPATLGELEDFFDYWRRRRVEPHIAALHSYAGQFESPAGLGWPTAPPRRRPCRRLATRLTVLADGTVVACEQDFKARAPIGSLAEQTLADIWTGEPMRSLRSDQRQLDFARQPMCAACDQWHRP